MPKRYPIINWANLININERKNFVEEKYLYLLNNHEKKNKQDIELKKAMMDEYDNEDSFIDDNIKIFEQKSITKIGNFFTSIDDFLVMELNTIKNKKKMSTTLKGTFLDQSKVLKNKISENNSIIVDSILSIFRIILKSDVIHLNDDYIFETDLKLKSKKHLSLILPLLIIEFLIMTKKVFIRNKVWKQICRIIPYCKKNYKHLSELLKIYQLNYKEKTINIINRIYTKEENLFLRVLKKKRKFLKYKIYNKIQKVVNHRQKKTKKISDWNALKNKLPFLFNITKNTNNNKTINFL